MILFLGFSASLLMNISRRERGLSLHDLSLSQKLKYWINIISPLGFIISSLIGIAWIMTQIIHHYH